MAVVTKKCYYSNISKAILFYFYSSDSGHCQSSSSNSSHKSDSDKCDSSHSSEEENSESTLPSLEPVNPFTRYNPAR